jgi:nicotinamidase-related amidase
MSQCGHKHAHPHHTDPSVPALPTMQLDPSKAGLVVIDPQVEFLSPHGVAWPFVGQCVIENRVVENLERLFISAKQAGLTIAISPHYYYPTDYQWQTASPLERVMDDMCLSERSGPMALEGFDGSGADFMPQFKAYILDGQTIVCSPHKVYGPETNDLVLELRRRGVSQVVLAGMAANLCVESHLRELVEHGFEVAVVRDATAAPRLPDGDGYLAALINYRYIANALWTTDEVLARLPS